ncbi:MAG: glycosyltransferase [Acidobacteriota bacterium]|nr:glycosyltransferase [Acidobacteriota bacterium]
MNKIRVLQVIPSFAIGGAERCVVQLMSALDPRQFEIAAVSLYAKQGTELEEILEQRRLPVTFLGKKRGLDLRMFGEIWRQIRNFRPHVVHTHLHAFNYVIPAVMAGRVQAAVHTVHSVAERERSRLVKGLPRMLFSRAVTPVAIAGEVQASIRRVFGVDSVLIPNGIPLDVYRSGRRMRAEWREQEGFRADDVVFVCVGRLDAVKNHEVLIDAFAQACLTMSSAHLLLVGGGEFHQQLRAQVEKLQLNSRVHFLGIRNDVPTILAASDVYTFASNHEGSPLSIMEALASGLPIAGTAVGGVPEMVTSETGILTRPRDVDSLASAMKVLCGDAKRRTEMGNAAAKQAARFDLTRMADAYGELYASLLDRRSFCVRRPALGDTRI